MNMKCKCNVMNYVCETILYKWRIKKLIKDRTQKMSFKIEPISNVFSQLF